MTMFKKNGGFTLVELIVVIAILAILAGVAIPAYSGYIKKAQDAAVVTELDAIATAAQAANAEAGEITKIEVTDDKTVVVTAAKIDVKNFAKDFAMFYDAEATTVLSNENKTATITLKTAIDKWASSSYAENGATWTAANGWN